MKNDISISSLLHNDRDREMYRELDTFLNISNYYSAKGIARIKAAGSIGSMLVAVLMWYVSRITENNTIPIFLMILSVLCALSFLFFYGNRPSLKYERIKTILSEDGVAAVYNDMTAADRIKGSDIYVGNEYVFDRTGGLFRRSDVTDVLISEFRGKAGMKSYWAVFHVSDSTDSGNVYIKTLDMLNSGKRIREFQEIKALFGK